MPPYPVQPTIGCDESCPCRAGHRQDPTCPCRMYPIGECPFCVVMVVHRATPKEPSSAVAEYDARMIERFGAAEYERMTKSYFRGGSALPVSESSSGATSAEGGDGSSSTAEPKARPRKKRRTKEEMAEVRAADADRIRRIRRRVTPDWLADQDIIEADFVASLKDSE